MAINETLTTVGNTDLNGIWYYISYIPKTLTQFITEQLNNYGFTVTERWTSGLFVLISLVLLYISIKLLEKANWIVKALIFILSILLLCGLFLVPSW